MHAKPASEQKPGIYLLCQQQPSHERHEDEGEGTRALGNGIQSGKGTSNGR